MAGEGADVGVGAEGADLEGGLAGAGVAARCEAHNELLVEELALCCTSAQMPVLVCLSLACALSIARCTQQQTCRFAPRQHPTIAAPAQAPFYNNSLADAASPLLVVPPFFVIQLPLT